MRDFCFCEQCQYSKLDVHKPDRTGEEIYNPKFYCTYSDRHKIEVNAFDYCSLGTMKPGLPLRNEQKVVREINSSYITKCENDESQDNLAKSYEECTSEDAVSRKDVFDLVTLQLIDTHGSSERLWANITAKKILKGLESLPPVSTKEESGSWIYIGHYSSNNQLIFEYQCSKCGKLSYFQQYDGQLLGSGKYCSSCGVKMASIDETEHGQHTK